MRGVFRTPQEVAVGQRYEAVGSGITWEVADVIKRRVVGTHAVLRRVDNPDTTKTVSLPTLCHAGFYRPVLKG